jgi:hypothetical protein
METKGEIFFCGEQKEAEKKWQTRSKIRTTFGDAERGNQRYHLVAKIMWMKDAK